MAMMRRAEIGWDGDLQTGSGTIRYVTSGAISRLPVTWMSRTEQHDGRTSPEELIAAAHASCYAMSLASRLAKNGTPAEHLEVAAAVTFDRVDGGWAITSSAITVEGTVPQIDETKFVELAEDAKENCPVSRAFKGNLEITLAATLRP
jgi:osmotically inducible protein OsmC